MSLNWPNEPMNAIVRASDIAQSLEDIQRLSRMFAVTSWFAAKGDTPMALAQIATQILAGREMGIGPFASVQGIHVIQGKPTMSANLMAERVKASGRYDYRVKTMSDTLVEIEFRERVDGKWESIGVSSFSMEDARRAGTQNTNKFPRNMLFARAMSNGVRWYTPDVFAANSVYTPDEMGAAVDDDGNVIDAPPSAPPPMPPAPAPMAPMAVIVDDVPAVDPQGDVEATQSDANPFEDSLAGVPSAAMQRKFHALGTENFGKDWNDRRPELIRWATNGVSERSADLTRTQMSVLIDKLERRLASRVAVTA